jgi:transcriptional regulator with XRE-family HTH domain
MVARNYRELQERMDPAARAENQQRVRKELERMALDELRSAKRLTQVDMAEMLDVPQSSISRIEQRADMYLSTLRNYVHALGGMLQIRVVFPDGQTVVIDRFGEYEDKPYVVRAQAEGGGNYRLCAFPFQHPGGPLSTKTFKVHGLLKTLKALNLAEPQISAVRNSLENNVDTEIGGHGVPRVFRFPDLIDAGFEPAEKPVALGVEE